MSVPSASAMAYVRPADNRTVPLSYRMSMTGEHPIADARSALVTPFDKRSSLITLPRRESTRGATSIMGLPRLNDPSLNDRSIVICFKLEIFTIKISGEASKQYLKLAVWVGLFIHIQFLYQPELEVMQRKGACPVFFYRTIILLPICASASDSFLIERLWDLSSRCLPQQTGLRA